MRFKDVRVMLMSFFPCLLLFDEIKKVQSPAERFQRNKCELEMQETGNKINIETDAFSCLHIHTITDEPQQDADACSSTHRSKAIASRQNKEAINSV